MYYESKVAEREIWVALEDIQSDLGWLLLYSACLHQYSHWIHLYPQQSAIGLKRNTSTDFMAFALSVTQHGNKENTQKLKVIKNNEFIIFRNIL